MPPSNSPAPTSPESRITSIDAVRGFALFGVILVNMYNFGAYSPLWDGSLDRFFNTLMHALFETKSLRLFSILFGFGFAMQLAKITANPQSSQWILVRRLAILFVFGMAHALLFDGDILMEYAMLGLLLLLFQKVPNRLLVILSVVLLAAFPIGNLLHEPGYQDLLMEIEDQKPLAALRQGHPYLGSLMEVFEENAAVIPPWPWENLQYPESSLAIFSMFLLGYWLGRARLIQRDADRRFPMGRVFRWCAVLGGLSAVLEWGLQQQFGYAVYSGNEAGPVVRFLGDALFTYGSTALALAYGAGIILLSRKAGWQAVLVPFRNLGRMALTVYLAGSLMFTTLFYGWGFGQLYRLGPAATTLWAVLFFVVLALFSHWWLGRFRYGPAEWLWRSLTYLKFQPLRLP